ncbi:hypothetical protein D8S46_12110 [Salmonella enterica subsp. enterica serovar Newport]|uniref:hypothetical protein n=1 Tax=Citrobacter youngae TaxID=133448 RepID=UPI00126EA8F7|nr:hypothetical protein [Salmonella enterica]EBZ2011873.1 hypothetical protein [Salmonella enterica subsp. enterica serovar Newport]ECF6083227.1 hypothetical protein [Salmonella enterica subsp. houtenae]EDF7585050.1 hypothetical protein [Salmonella enterica subsp. enterica serovar Newport]EEV4750060.1 hypothetical protein [Salmonella enterica]
MILLSGYRVVLLELPGIAGNFDATGIKAVSLPQRQANNKTSFRLAVQVVSVISVIGNKLLYF